MLSDPSTEIVIQLGKTKVAFLPKVRHPDHKTIYLDGWHRVYMNRERFAPHVKQIAFLD
jgi:hypothetical protein